MVVNIVYRNVKLGSHDVELVPIDVLKISSERIGVLQFLGSINVCHVTVVCGDHRFTSADPIAYQAKYMSDGSFFLDFDKVQEDTETYKLISNPNYIGLMGEGYVPENDFCADNFRTIMAVKDHFDAMIYYYKVDPIRVLDYEG